VPLAAVAAMVSLSGLRRPGNARRPQCSATAERRSRARATHDALRSGAFVLDLFGSNSTERDSLRESNGRSATTGAIDAPLSRAYDTLGLLTYTRSRTTASGTEGVRLLYRSGGGGNVVARDVPYKYSKSFSVRTTNA
jgi:hypothetical protein